MQKICKICEDEFMLLPTHKGLAIHCPDCAKETTTKYLACVSWDGKSHGSIEITKDTEFANSFNRAQKRSGYGVGRSLVEKKTPSKSPTQSHLRSSTSASFVQPKTTKTNVDGLSEYYKRH